MRLPRIIGHRGAAAQAPENTLAGFRRAAELGLEWVEFDVRPTRDGRLILLHDDSLDRTTNGHGRARDMSFAEIHSLDAGGWYAQAFAGEPVPCLEDALDLIAGLGLGANIEIKAGPGDEAAVARAVAGIVARHWPAGREPPLISSFRYEVAAAVAAHAPDLPLAYLMDWDKKDWSDKRDALDWRSIHCNQRRLTAARVAGLKAAGLPVVAYTVNSVRRMKKLFGIGVDAIISDFPATMASAL